MRKRIVIGVAVVAVVGITAFLLSPRKGTLKWHREEYLRIEEDGLWQKSLRCAPFGIGVAYTRRLTAKSDFHYEALVQLGYFEEKTFVVTNRSFGATSPHRDLLPYLTNVEHRLTGIIAFTDNSVTFSALRDDMEELEKAIRKFDVPEK